MPPSIPASSYLGGDGGGGGEIAPVEITRIDWLAQRRGEKTAGEKSLE